MALILLVEDEKLLRWALEQQLKRAGHTVLAAPDLASAVAHLESRQPDVVLLDLGLPDGHGLDFYEANRERLEGSVVIVMTALGQVGEAVRAMKLGALDFLSKPVDQAELVALVHRSLGGARRPARGAGVEAEPRAPSRPDRHRRLAEVPRGDRHRRAGRGLRGGEHPDPGRERLGQERRGALHPRRRRRGARGRSSRSPARRFRRTSSRASSSATRRAPSPTPRAPSAASSSSPRAARWCSTRSASCVSTCRRSSCTFSRSAASGGSAGRARSPPTCG